MGKSKRSDQDVTDSFQPMMEEPAKKKVKHKHKKHRKKKDRSPSACSEEIDVVGLDMRQEEARPLKLKIKFGGQAFGPAKVVHVPKAEEEIDSQDLSTYEEQELSVEPSTSQDVLLEGSEDQFSDSNDVQTAEVGLGVRKVKGSEDEEEKWLDALETGDLDDFGCLKKSKKVSAMTARQRSLYGHSVCGENELLELPLFTKKRDEDTEEVERRRKQRAKKRRQQMQQQIEENKAQTINKLLSKQPTKQKKEDKASRKKQPSEWSHVRYLDNADGLSLSLTEGVELPWKHQPHLAPPSVQLCAVKGCSNAKKYSCSTTKQPICSLQCYKQVQAMRC